MRVWTQGQTAADALVVRADLPFTQAKAALVEVFERRYLLDVLARMDGNVSAAAREANMDRKHLRSLLTKYGLLPRP